MCHSPERSGCVDSFSEVYLGSGDIVKCPLSTSGGTQLALKIWYHGIIDDTSSLTLDQGTS